MTLPDDIEPRPSPGGRGRRGLLAGFAFVSRSLQQVSTFVITLMAARFLLPEEYGIYTLGVVFITFIQTLTYTGLYHFLVTSTDEDGDVLSTGFWLLLGLAVSASLLLAALAGPIAGLFDAPELQGVLVAFAALQPVAAAEAWWSAIVLRRQAMRLHFSIMFVTNLSSIAGGVALLWIWQSLWALVAFRYLHTLTGTVLYALFARARPGLAFDRGLARRAAAYASGLYGARILTFLSRYAGDLLLGLTFSTAEAGLYRFGNRVATGATDIVTQPMQSFSLSQFGAANRAERDLAPLVRQFAGTMVLLTGGVAATVIVLSAEVVRAFFEPAYLGGIVVAYAMATRAVIGLGGLILDPILAARGRTGAVMRYTLVWTVLTILSAVATAPLGLAALAWSQALIAGAASIAAIRLVRDVGEVPTVGLGRTIAVAVGLVVAYGLALRIVWPLTGASLEPGLSVLAGLAWAVVLGALTLVAGWRLKVVSLAIFSG